MKIINLLHFNEQFKQKQVIQKVIISLDDKMDLSDDEYFECTPPELKNAAESASLNLLPEKSKNTYELIYNKFMTWQKLKKTTSFSESVLMAYFLELSGNKQPSTLWSYYSMLKLVIQIKNNIDISKYNKLISFLKKKNHNFKSVQAKVFTPEQVQRFLKEAPNEKYLSHKVNKI